MGHSSSKSNDRQANVSRRLLSKIVRVLKHERLPVLDKTAHKKTAELRMEISVAGYKTCSAFAA